MEKKKCSCGGVEIRPDGKHLLDPCVYQEEKSLKNVTIHILKCKYCGNYDIEWEKQEDTEELFDD